MLKSPTSLSNVWQKFARSYATRNLRGALEDASKCTHPEAQELWSLSRTWSFVGDGLVWDDVRREVALIKKVTPVVAFVRACAVYSLEQMQAAANMGCVMAQAHLGWVLQSDEWREKAAAGKDPSSMLFLASTRYKGKPEELSMMRECAMLGDVAAPLGCYGAIHKADPNNMDWVYWLFEATRVGPGFYILLKKIIMIHKLPPAIIYKLGEGLTGHIEPTESRIFGQCTLGFDGTPCFDNAAATATLATSAYERWNKQAKRAILCWIWTSKQFGLAKDIRTMIGKMLWSQRVCWAK